MAKNYKFGQRESDALFDLMGTLEISNLAEPVGYLAVIKAAHKEILELRDKLTACEQLETAKHKYARFLHVCAASGEKPETFEWFLAKESEPTD